MKRHFAAALATLMAFPALAADKLPVQKAKSVGDLLDQGGLTMWCIFALSFLTLAMAAYYLMIFRKSEALPDTFVTQAEEAADKGDLGALRDLCAANPSPIAEIVGAAVEQIEANPKANQALIRSAAESVGGQHAEQMIHKIYLLTDVVAMGPMLGLLGTVIGTMDAFGSTLGSDRGSQTLQLAEGVSKALVNTAAGLVVALVATMVFVFFRVKVNALTVDLERKSSRILTKLFVAKKLS